MFMQDNIIPGFCVTQSTLFKNGRVNNTITIKLICSNKNYHNSESAKFSPCRDRNKSLIRYIKTTVL